MSSLLRGLTGSECLGHSDCGTSTSEEGGSIDWYICNVCSGFGERDHPRAIFNLNSDAREGGYVYNYFYFHYPNPVLLAHSAKNGCQICELIVSYFRGLWNIQLDNLTWEEAQAEVQELENKRLATWAKFLQDDTTDFSSAQDAAGLDKHIETARLEGHSILPSSALHGKGRIFLTVPCLSDQKSLRNTSGVHSVRIEILDDPFAGMFKSPRVMFFISSPSDHLDPDFLHRPTSDVFSREHLELVERWIFECSMGHEACGRVGPLQQLPTRVLKMVPSTSTGDVEMVRLVETGGATGCYAALSYCWGLTPQVEKTTKSNLHRQLDGIPLQILPKTIADAIRLCCKLGFDFIWVDALCIIQDDFEDWTREAAKMSEVYGNSALTIVSSIVRDSSESFVDARRAGGFPRESFAELPYRDSDSGLAGSIWFGDYFGGGSWALQKNWESINKEKREPYEWLGRAWCFQEWILSPRILQIHNMTLWDCFQGYANEVTKRHVEPTWLRRDLLGSGSSIPWSRMVAEFTSRAITNASDRLPALAGLAKTYARATGRSTYLAGIWFEDLPAALLWSGRIDDSGVRKLDFPSFTWLSTDTAVDFEGPDDEYYRGDFEIKTRATAWSCSDHGQPTYTSKGFTVDFEGPLGLVTGLMPPKMDMPPLHKQWGVVVDRKGTYMEEIIAASELYLMLIVCGRRFSVLQPSSYEYQALVIRKTVEENGVDCFERLGRAYLILEKGQAPPDIPPPTPECAVWERSKFRLK